MSWCETECKKKCAIGETECKETWSLSLKQNAKKNVPLVKQNVMKLEVFVLEDNNWSEEKEGMGEREKREDWERE